MKYTAENLLVRSQDRGGSGIFAQVTPERAGWEHLSMTARRLQRGDVWRGQTGNNEYLHVILGGVCNIRTSQGHFFEVGRRPNVFSGLPYALYLSRGVEFELEALTTDFEVATAWTATDRDYAPFLVTPAGSQIELRGRGNASRQINSVVPPGSPVHKLVCVEVYTPGGNWSSYPPHKHDEHIEDENGLVLEADLEEIYFYKLDAPEGYAYQRVYTDDRSIDGLVLAQNNDTVIIPRGYHPVVSAHGYTTYYLNFLAGSAQSLAATDDPAYRWVRQAWLDMELDPRVPLISPALERNATPVNVLPV
jgi:5-deoxy-glucuronate isomerase